MDSWLILNKLYISINGVWFINPSKLDIKKKKYHPFMVSHWGWWILLLPKKTTSFVARPVCSRATWPTAPAVAPRHRRRSGNRVEPSDWENGRKAGRFPWVLQRKSMGFLLLNPPWHHGSIIYPTFLCQSIAWIIDETIHVFLARTRGKTVG